MDEWIPTREAARISGYHPEHIRRLSREGKLRARKFGMGWAVEKHSLEQYIAEAGDSDDRRRGPHRDPTGRD